MIIGETLLRSVRSELLDQLPGLVAFHALEAVRVHWIDEQDRAAGHRMVDHRRARLLGIFLVGPAHFFFRIIEARAGGAVGAAVQPDQTGEAVLHRLRQRIVGGAHIGKHRPALRRRNL